MLLLQDQREVWKSAKCTGGSTMKKRRLFPVEDVYKRQVVESGLGGESAVIKSHHNVGGLPDFVDFKEIIEPVSYTHLHGPSAHPSGFF